MSDTKFFLKCGKTGRWYTESERWGHEPAVAHEFATMEEALRRGRELGVHVMVVVLPGGESERQTVLTADQRR